MPALAGQCRPKAGQRLRVLAVLAASCSSGARACFRSGGPQGVACRALPIILLDCASRGPRGLQDPLQDPKPHQQLRTIIDISDVQGSIGSKTWRAFRHVFRDGNENPLAFRLVFRDPSNNSTRGRRQGRSLTISSIYPSSLVRSVSMSSAGSSSRSPSPQRRPKRGLLVPVVFQMLISFC